MRWLPGALATPAQGPGARLNRSHPLARGLVWWTDAPQRSNRAAQAVSVGQAFDPGAALVTGPSFGIGGLSDITMLSFGVLNGTPNSGNYQAGIRIASTIARLEAFTGNAQVSAVVSYSDFTSASIPATAHGVSVNGGVLALGLRHIRGATNGMGLFVNGRLLASANAQNKTLVNTVTNAEAHWAQAGTCQGYLTAFNGLWSRALLDEEILALSRNPWQLFEPAPRPLWSPQVVAVTVYRPGSDVAVNGWTATPGGSLASCIDDPTLNRSDFITSPNLSSPATLAWASAQPAGTYSLSIDADRTGGSGQVRVVCLDAGGASVGATAWQALTATATTYTLSVTTTGTSTQLRIEVQA